MSKFKGTKTEELKSYILAKNNKKYPISELKSQNGLKRDIVELVLNLAEPDDDCMLSDFLHALQFVLDKHTECDLMPSELLKLNKELIVCLKDSIEKLNILKKNLPKENLLEEIDLSIDLYNELITRTTL